MLVQNPWQQYFQDQELRQTIEQVCSPNTPSAPLSAHPTQDVHRTYPEIEFFKEPQVQQDLTDILFCYSRRYSAVGYRQVRFAVLAQCRYSTFGFLTGHARATCHRIHSPASRGA